MSILLPTLPAKKDSLNLLKNALPVILVSTELLNMDEPTVFKIKRQKADKVLALSNANTKLKLQFTENQKIAPDLESIIRELKSLNAEKEKRAAELLVANKELKFQNKENHKRATELIVANRELKFQNKEREKLAAELQIANKELIFQNDEKEKKAIELCISNKQLFDLNAEYKATALELRVANKDFKAVEKLLKEVNSELETFSYSVSHDLRAPLRAIASFSNILMDEYGDKLDAEATRLIGVVIENAEMMSGLIDDLLTFSRMARLEVLHKNINMEVLARKSMEETLLLVKQPVAVFNFHEILPCNGDAKMLKQVWANLVSNAIKYSSKKEKPEVEIGSKNNDLKIIYYIKDNGAGFEMKYSKNLFGIFQRLHRHDEFEGTGLGLALAKRIINKHGGEIWAESVINEGTTFFFSIPK